MGSRTYSFDKQMQLADGAAAVTASGFTQVGGAIKILDLGGALNRFDLGVIGSEARIDCALVVDVSAISTATDGHYRLHVMGSNNPNMLAPVSLGCLDIGLGTKLFGGPIVSGGVTLGVAGAENAAISTGSNLPTGNTTVVGRREILFTTEQSDVMNEYIGLWVEVLGTTSASIQFTAFVAVLPLE